MISLRYALTHVQSHCLCPQAISRPACLWICVCLSTCVATYASVSPAPPRPLLATASGRLMQPKLLERLLGESIGRIQPLPFLGGFC